MTEKDLERKIVSYCKARGCLVYKFTSPGQRAVPDRIIILPNGKVIFMEFKAPGKKPTKLQLREIQKLLGQWQSALWIDGFDSAVYNLRKYGLPT